MDEDFEDSCEVEFDRGLGRVFVCSLGHKHLGPHVAYPYHNVVDYHPRAVWIDDTILYCSQDAHRS